MELYAWQMGKFLLTVRAQSESIQSNIWGSKKRLKHETGIQQHGLLAHK